MSDWKHENIDWMPANLHINSNFGFSHPWAARCEGQRCRWLGEGTDQQDGFVLSLFPPGRRARTGGGWFPVGGGGGRLGRRHQQQFHRLVVVVEVVDGRRLCGAPLHGQQPLPAQHAPRARFLHIHISLSTGMLFYDALLFFQFRLQFRF